MVCPPLRPRRGVSADGLRGRDEAVPRRGAAEGARIHRRAAAGRLRSRLQEVARPAGGDQPPVAGARLLRRRHPFGDLQPRRAPGAAEARCLQVRRLPVDGLGRRLPGLQPQHAAQPERRPHTGRAVEGRVPVRVLRHGGGGSRGLLPPEQLQLPGPRRAARLPADLCRPGARHHPQLPGSAPLPPDQQHDRHRGLRPGAARAASKGRQPGRGRRPAGAQLDRHGRRQAGRRAAHRAAAQGHARLAGGDDPRLRRGVAARRREAGWPVGPDGAASPDQGGGRGQRRLPPVRVPTGRLHAADRREALGTPAPCAISTRCERSTRWSRPCGLRRCGCRAANESPGAHPSAWGISTTPSRPSASSRGAPLPRVCWRSCRSATPGP